MALLGRIRPLYFFAAFAVGLMVCYMMSPKPDVVVKFPSPYNAGRVIYKDKAANCYKYSADKVPCPSDGSKVKPQPIMEDFNNSKLRAQQQTHPGAPFVAK
jgi:hypothetical protein